MKKHPEPAELRDLVSRSVEALDEDEPLLEHLSHCDECFQIYEDLWAEVSQDLPELSEMFVDSAASQRLEGRLFRRLHVASLGSASGWLVTDGFLRVVVGVLLPVLAFEHAPTARARGEKP